jgi:hypothetical protein
MRQRQQETNTLTQNKQTDAVWAGSLQHTEYAADTATNKHTDTKQKHIEYAASTVTNTLTENEKTDMFGQVHSFLRHFLRWN